MSNATSATSFARSGQYGKRSSFVRSEDGASLTEFLIILPLLVLTVFAVVDMGLYMWQWNHAVKSTQMGARIAVLVPPVAVGINVAVQVEGEVGDECTAADGSGHPDCPTPGQTTICNSTGCSNGFVHNPAAFDAIVDGVVLGTFRYPGMLDVLPTLERENVEIRYSATGLGYVGRPGGHPMIVTVGLRCASTQLIVLDFLSNLALADGCPTVAGAAPLPPYFTTLTSESLGAL